MHCYSRQQRSPFSNAERKAGGSVAYPLYVVLRAFILYSHVYFSLISKKGLSIIIAGKRVDRPSLVLFHSVFLCLTINIRDDIALLKSSSIIVTQWPMAGHNDTSTEQHDLSPYELLRLTKIRRNADRLAALGLGSSIATSAGRKAPVARKRPRPKETNKLPARPPTRLSKRLRDWRVKGNREFNVLDSPAHALDREQDDDVSCTTIDYSKCRRNPTSLTTTSFRSTPPFVGGASIARTSWKSKRTKYVKIAPCVSLSGGQGTINCGVWRRATMVRIEVRRLSRTISSSVGDSVSPR